MPSLYADAAIAVRPEIANAHAAALQQIAGAGTWLDGPTRVAVAREALTAHECKRCGEARQSLSPTAVSGPHDDLGLLSANVVDVVHRVTTDPGRLSRAWLKGILSGGMSDTEYVETVGVVARILSISAFARAVGLAGLAVPEPRDGEPTRRRPEAAVLEDSWVARIPESGATGELADLYAGEPNFPGVGRSLSLVPDEVYAVRDLMRVQYYDFHRVPNPRNHRKLLRVQEQLIAARVSALLECFYWTSGHSVLLRVSGKLVETDVDISSIAADAVTGTGVPHEADLVGWAEAVLARDVPATERHRSRLVEDLGVDAANDAAGVIATFNMVTRMADAAGIPVDSGFEQFMGSTVEDAGIAHLRHD